MLRAPNATTRLAGCALVALLVLTVNWSSTAAGGRLFLLTWTLTALLLAPFDRRLALAGTMALGVTIGLAVSLVVGPSGWGETAVALTAPLALAWLGRAWQWRTMARTQLSKGP